LSAICQTETAIPIYTTYDINSNMPEEMEIVQALKKTRLNKAPGPSGVTVDMIQKWYYDTK
jgi:hypothetical protein